MFSLSFLIGLACSGYSDDLIAGQRVRRMERDVSIVYVPIGTKTIEDGDRVFYLESDGLMRGMLGHAIKPEKCGGLLKGRSGGRKTHIHVILENERATSLPVLAGAVTALKNAEQSPFDDAVDGPPRAIIFVHLQALGSQR